MIGTAGTEIRTRTHWGSCILSDLGAFRGSIEEAEKGVTDVVDGIFYTRYGWLELDCIHKIKPGSFL